MLGAAIPNVVVMVKCRLGFVHHCRKYTYTFKVIPM